MSLPEALHMQWRKSSHSGGQGGDCVEVAAFETGIGVRDSREQEGPRLTFGVAEWRVFAERVKASEFDLKG
ncbi:DUF397 domain-containing protein [Actinomadura madurae]|uniref:DUF397 domain-containing protein n=1 Tax=Actinomadura madurae TaxID=1993 RepID=A0A1I5BVM3_9ACTN|nr:DUF397 domain-containing protein [Actinomadura madurae]SFN78401.1 protein of unknown function [Actinomadura madurae]SPT50929.1 Domain of uncharacterised function (DUF397) [Actinomadura madurae]